MPPALKRLSARITAPRTGRGRPRAHRFAATNRLMKGHLDQTLDEAAHRLGGDFPADIRDYERIHRHILMMADAISTGIIKQFPRRFR